MATDQAIQELYLNTSDPGSLGGVEPLYKSSRDKGLDVSRKRIIEFLKKNDTYTLHKPIRRKFSRNLTIVGDIDKQWQADLADVSSLSRQNGGHNFILTVIDCFSKYAWAIPLKKKDAPSVLKGFKILFEQSRPRRPVRIQTDKGKEFLNKPLQEYLKERGIHHFVTQNETKAAIVERFNRTLKAKMFRYFHAYNTSRYLEELPNFLKAYNNSKHRTIGMAPSKVTKEKVPEIWKRVYRHKKYKTHKFENKDTVRISAAKTIFDKGYRPNWSEEVFKISNSKPTPKKVYKIEDLKGSEIKGTFYPEEIQPVTFDLPEKHIVEKIVHNRKRKGVTELLIKWKGYPSTYNSWIPEKDLNKYGEKG